MRHNVYGKHLGRDKNQRSALFKSLVLSLLISESIETTESKAKAVKGLVDKLITQAKSPTTKRLVHQFITQKKVADKLITEIVPRLQNRNSGYTSVVKLGRRLGDGAMVVKMSLLLEELQEKPQKKEAKEAVVEEVKKESKTDKPKVKKSSAKKELS